MLRRRPRSREIPFSFDSFLDIVANVVGVIIRLILVVWVGARSYSSLTPTPPAAAPRGAELAEEADPLEAEIAAQRRALARLQEELLTHLRQVDAAADEGRHLERDLVALNEERAQLELNHAALRHQAAATAQEGHAVALTVEELRRHREKLQAELAALGKLPPPGKVLRYRTPVSQPIHAEQLMFEVRHGRIAYVDIAALTAEVRQSMEETGRQLRTSRSVQGQAGPIGPFRLHYTIERERGPLDAVGAAADAGANFRFALTEWRVEPLPGTRGELPEQAVAAGSAFRQIVDSLDPRQAVLTVWVYPDSFAAYRQLRDYLHDRDFVVAGRPLPEGAPIAASQRGSVSRGQ